MRLTTLLLFILRHSTLLSNTLHSRNKPNDCLTNTTIITITTYLNFSIANDKQRPPPNEEVYSKYNKQSSIGLIDFMLNLFVLILDI